VTCREAPGFKRDGSTRHHLFYVTALYQAHSKQTIPFSANCKGSCVGYEMIRAIYTDHWG